MTGLEERDAAAGAVAKKPRVTLDQIKTLIDHEEYHIFDNASESGERYPALTVCVLTLKNGYKVVGHSACADPENFNEELGHKIAKDKAIGEIWPLAGFLLRDRLHREDHPPVMRCKVVLSGRHHAYQEARDKDYKPLGRYTEEPWSYERDGKTISGMSYVPDKADPANVTLDGEHLSFHAVCPPSCDPNGAPENLIFGEMTPNFRIEGQVRNHAVLSRLKQGQAYYVDFIPAD